MQPSVHLSQKDVARLHKAAERLWLLVQGFTFGVNGAVSEKPKRRYRRRRAVSSEPAKPRRRRVSQEPADPSSSA